MQRLIIIVASVIKMLAILMNPVLNVDRKKREREREKALHTPTKYIECEIKIALVFEWPINIAYFTKH